MTSPMTGMEAQRDRMVSQQIAGRGIRDPQVLAAMREVPREAFVADNYREFAYDDGPLPILEGQTISQPYVVALMIELLKLQYTHRVLEIGTGSGYAAAVLSRIASEVFSVERVASLVDYAENNIEALGYDNVWVLHGDGTLGWPEHSRYDAIIVAAGGPSVPEALRDQLAIGGRIIMPVGREQRSQRLVQVVRESEQDFEEKKLSYVRFVPLIGKQGWKKEKRRWTDFF